MIREATFDDLEEAILLGYEMHQESRHSVFAYSPERVASFFSQCIVSDDYLFLVEQQQSGIVGGFIGFCLPQWFSDDLHAGDFALFLKPEARGGTSALRMVKQYTYWAKRKGAKVITLGVSTGVKREETGALYEFCGYRKFGDLYEYREVA